MKKIIKLFPDKKEADQTDENIMTELMDTLKNALKDDNRRTKIARDDLGLGDVEDIDDYRE